MTDSKAARKVIHRIIAEIELVCPVCFQKQLCGIDQTNLPASVSCTGSDLGTGVVCAYKYTGSDLTADVSG